MNDNIRPAREGYASIDLDLQTENQQMIADMFIHEGELREQDAIIELLIKKTPPLEGDTEFIHGFKAGYSHALYVVTERVYGPEEPEEILVEEVEDDFDITDVDDPE